MKLEKSTTPVAAVLLLLITVLTLLAMSCRSHLAEAPATAPAAAPAPVAVAPEAAAAPQPEPVAVPVPEPMAVPAPEPVAAPEPAVVTAEAPPAAAAQAVPAVFNERARGLSPQVLAMALDAMSCARAEGVSGRDDLLTVIDYSLPSTEPRLWVLDLERGEVLFHELVAHGRGSGDNYATRFSNVNDSHQTSLGLFLTGGTYEGGNGYSLRLKGLDEGLNDRAEARHIVMHGAWYVSEEHARKQGRLGRSWGCPALSQDVAPEVIDTIKGGSFVFSYHGGSSEVLRASQRTCGGSGGGSGLAPAVALAR